MSNDRTAPEAKSAVEESSDTNGHPAAERPKAQAVIRPKKRKGQLKASGSRPKVRRPFPQNTLEEAMAIPQAIKEKNNGKPLGPETVAKACGTSQKSPKFFYLAGSSRD